MTESTLHHVADAVRPVAATDGVSGLVASSRPVGILIGYARCSTDKQDLTAQRWILSELGVEDERVYLDHGLTGRNRSRPGLTQALAALREGDTLVVPKLDRLGGSVYDPNDPMGKMFFNILATFAEFEADLLRMRTREGMAIARANGRLKGKPPKLSATQRALLLKLYRAREHSIAELAELFSVSRATVYREIARTRPKTRQPNRAATSAPEPSLQQRLARLCGRTVLAGADWGSAAKFTFVHTVRRTSCSSV